MARSAHEVSAKLSLSAEQRSTELNACQSKFLRGHGGEPVLRAVHRSAEPVEGMCSGTRKQVLGATGNFALDQFTTREFFNRWVGVKERTKDKIPRLRYVAIVKEFLTPIGKQEDRPLSGVQSVILKIFGMLASTQVAIPSLCEQK